MIATSKTWFENPFNEDLKVFCVICPSHQLKNQINALFSSKAGGTKLFTLSFHTPYFGWQSIRDLYKREIDRADRSQLRFIPKLKKSYVERDAWIKLSVLPAKIMQQGAVLRELESYLNPENGLPPPHDYSSVEPCFQYLTACNKLFENGILSHDPITTMDSVCIQNMRAGYKFFTDWFNRLQGESEVLADQEFNPTNPMEKVFLAWQTWDLLRLMFYGFTQFCDDFLTRHGDGYYVVPLKLNGSAVETLFSQFKSLSGGKLSGTNYPSVRKMFLSRRDVLGHRPSAAVAGYRDVPLYIRDQQ